MALLRLCGLFALAPTVLGRSRGGNNNCNQGRGYCIQWTNHSANQYSVRTPMGTWECMYGQVAIGYPDEEVMGMQDAFGNQMPIAYKKSAEYAPDSEWVNDNMESGRCKGCGCQCDVEYKCTCVSRDMADEGNQAQLNVLYGFTAAFLVIGIIAIGCAVPLLMQVGAEREFCRELLEERKANVAASAGNVTNPMAQEAASNVPVPNVTAGMNVAVVIPDGMEAGQQMSVDPDGPEGPLPPVLVSIPEGLKAGDTMQVYIPTPVQAAPVTAAVPYNSMQGMMMMQSRMPGPLGGPRTQIPGAMGRTPGPEFDPPPGYNPNKEYPSGPMGCWSAYPLTPDAELERSVNRSHYLFGKYLSCPGFFCTILSVLVLLCVVLQPEENEYYTGCYGDANAASSSVASMAMLAAALLLLTS